MRGQPSPAFTWSINFMGEQVLVGVTEAFAPAVFSDLLTGFTESLFVTIGFAWRIHILSVRAVLVLINNVTIF